MAEGLTAQQVIASRQAHGTNVLTPPPRRGLHQTVPLTTETNAGPRSHLR